MTILDKPATTDDAAWDEFLVGLATPSPERRDGSPGLTCRWVPDPAAPERMVCVWSRARS